MGILFWFVLTLVLLIFEACTLGLVTIWFAVGSIITAILSLAVETIWIQWMVFAVISALSLILIRPLILDKVNSKVVRTNSDSLIGEKGRVEVKIDNFNGTGEVVVKGQNWTAVSDSDNKVIEVGAPVKIKEIRGVKLVVEEIKEG
ncbi:MAG: NfeD family protein [Lachnospiraceae bacterium]